MDGAIRRVPAIADAEVTRMINGPEGFTPDNEFILGESEVRGFFVAAGFSAHGIAGAGGIGRQMASWIVDGEAELDLWKMDIRRFGAQYRSRRLHARPRLRELRDLLRHPLPQRGAPVRPAAPALAGVPAAGRARRLVRREVRLGAPELVRAQRGRPGVRRSRPRSRRSGRAAGRVRSGTRRSRQRRSPRGRRRHCSTRPASPRSRSPVRAPSRCWAGCAPTTWTGPWAA